MVRNLALATSCLLFAGSLFAQEKVAPDKKREATPEAAADKAAKRAAQKDAPDAQKQAARAAAKKERAPDGSAAKGRLTKIGVESGVVRLTVDGKEYDFATTENTLVLLKTVERDGKQVVVAVQLLNGEGVKAGGEKREAIKKEQPKNADDKPAEKKPS